MVKLLKIVPAEKSSNKKYVATFLLSNDEIKHTYFGSRPYTDYTLGATGLQRTHYWKRHNKDLRGKVYDAGILSLYILWGNHRDINKNIQEYRRLFSV